jgi:hypothetical protein
MNQVYQVFRFEVQARWKALVAALVVGLLALAAPLLPQWSHLGIDTVRAVTALIMAVAFSAATALGFGAAILAGPLARGREGFFISRPLGLFRLWLGRFLAVVFLCLGTGALALLPALLLRPDEPVWSGFLTRFSVPLILAILVTLISAAALFRLLIGRRSIWALGVPVAMIFVFWLWRESAGLVVQMGMLDVGLIVSLFVGPLLVAFLTASIMAAIRGRSDFGRAAQAGGSTACILLVALVILQWAGLRWINAATPADVVRIGSIIPAPEGPWVLESGEVERWGIRFGRTFLLNTVTGAWSRERQLFGNVWMGSFSGDGRSVVLLDSESIRDGADTVLAKIVDLGGPDDLPGTSGLLPVEKRAGIALSPNGAKAISREGGRFRLWDVGSARVLTQATGEFERPRLRVEDSGEAWIFDRRSDDSGRSSCVVFRLRPGQKAFERIWEQDGISPKNPPLIGGPTDADAVFFLVKDPETISLSIVVRRLTTGELLWRTSLDIMPGRKGIYPIDEGGVMLATWKGHGPNPMTLSLIREEGPVWSLDVGVVEWAVMGPMLDPETMVLSLRPRLSERRTSLVDIGTGTVRGLSETQLSPAAWPLMGSYPKAGSPGARLFIRSQRELLTLDVEGTLQPVRIGK